MNLGLAEGKSQPNSLLLWGKVNWTFSPPMVLFTGKEKISPDVFCFLFFLPCDQIQTIDGYQSKWLETGLKAITEKKLGENGEIQSKIDMD